MTPQEAGRIRGRVMATTVQRQEGTLEPAAEKALEKLFLSHLLPLPYEKTLAHVCEWLTQNRWCSTLEELLDACGVPDGARRDLVRAIREGGHLMPSLRSFSGWEYIAPDEALPQGVAEFFVNAGLPLPREVDPALERISAPVKALPPPQDVSPEQRRENLRRLGGMYKALSGKSA